MRSSNNKAYIFVTFSSSPLLRICFVFYQEFIRVCEYVRGMLHSLPLFALMCSKQALESPAVRAYCWSRQEVLIACAAEQKRDERVEGRSRLVGSSRGSLSQSRYCTPIVQLLLRLPSTPLSCDRARNAPVPLTPAGCTASLCIRAIGKNNMRISCTCIQALF